MTVAEVVLNCLGAYLFAGVPVGLILVRLTHRGVDVRQLGTGNVGTSNIFRNVGVATAAVVGPLQFAQGLVPVLVARGLGLPAEAVVAVAVASVAGSGFSPWLRLRGGRGVAVATGAVAGLGVAGLISLLLCYAAGLVVGEIAAGVIVGFCVLPAVELATTGVTQAVGAALILLVLLLRRLEGVVDDLRTAEDQWGVLLDRLLRDRRPGQRLVGRRNPR
jgi:glycerol-3-phosphate acyltransferase PlsY